ncbi:fructosamine kinase family protein [Amycolatopsis sp.]|jgi:fructosamine-3-kinase|uniref:fructosamine kinase family protein n=1 Tax=Amycolatopsis sp. TaxID=37632 RepID=UPI002DFF6008|nr:fructosamine kinase family protein [Amycolatopsis sp.]
MTDTAEVISRLVGEPIHELRRLGSAVYLVSTGRRLMIAKRGAGPGASPAEAAGLRWLSEPGDVPIPEVRGDDAEWVVMDYVYEGPSGQAAAEAFGRGLAALHLRGAPAFGSPPPGGPADAWMGLAPMRNEPGPEWPAFYATHRVEPYVRSCVDQGLFDADQAGVFDEVCSRLPELAGDPEPPARLHGDAWSGNVLWGSDGQAWLIDPAAHGGHRETDLAMLQLFGTPQLTHVLGAYREQAEQSGSPLADGVEKRVHLHQLFPLLMHAEVFGGGYVHDAIAAAHGALR